MDLTHLLYWHTRWNLQGSSGLKLDWKYDHRNVVIAHFFEHTEQVKTVGGKAFQSLGSLLK